MTLQIASKNNSPVKLRLRAASGRFTTQGQPTQGHQYYFIHPKVDALITPTFNVQHSPLYSDADRPIKLMQAVLEDRSLAVLPPKVDDWIITGF
jgi:hypothetical protein